MSAFQVNFEVRSTLKEGGVLELSLVEASVPRPGQADDVVVEMRAAPINPSDMRMLLGPADPASAKIVGADGNRVTALHFAEDRYGDASVRMNRPLPIGVEGAGVVVAAGQAPAAQALLGKVVAIMGGGMFTRYRMISAANCLPMPDGITPAEAASCFVNPLTALAMVETMRAEGYAALIHTAAASNLGQMLNRICIEDGIGLVNVVRSPDQAKLLTDAGAAFACDMSAENFTDSLTDAIRSTGANLAFDATGGGRLAGRLLAAMELALIGDSSALRSYGSEVRKQVYIYGNLEAGPTIVDRTFGTTWTLGGFSLFSFLGKASPETVSALKARVANGIRTTFASSYSDTLSLGDLLDPALIPAYAQRATGKKYLIDPSLTF